MTNGRDMTLKDQNIHLRIIDSGWDYPKENFLVKCVMSRPWVIIKVLYDTATKKISIFFSKKRWPLSVLLSLFMFKIMKKISTKFCQWSSSMTAHMSMDRRRKELLLFFFTTHSRRIAYALFFSTGRVNVFYWVGNSLGWRLRWHCGTPFLAIISWAIDFIHKI